MADMKALHFALLNGAKKLFETPLQVTEGIVQEGMARGEARRTK